MGKSRILIIGATGNLGYQLAKSSLEASHPTIILVRDSAFNCTQKLERLRLLSNAGVTLLKGSLQDEHCVIEAVKQADVVISAVPSYEVLSQKLLVRVIKRVGTVKRFIPSEFGSDPDKVQISKIDKNFYSNKAEIRRLIEAEGIPYTYISCNFFMSYLLPSLVQAGERTPPKDKVTIFGDGNVKAVFMKESDVAAFTISAVDDPRTLNKVIYLRPPGNVYSMNELVELWEKKTGKEFQKNYVPEEVVLKEIEDNDTLSTNDKRRDTIFIYSAFVKGDQTYFDIESSGGLDGTKLYPNLVYTTVSKHLDTLLK